MLAHKFIDLLESENLLDPEMIDELRRQVAQSGDRLPVETLAKLLVDTEQLTKFQATRLVSRLKSRRNADARKDTATATTDDELTIASGDDRLSENASDDQIPMATIVDDDVEQVEMIDDDDLYNEDVVIADVVDEGPSESDYEAAEVVEDSTTLRRPMRTSAAPLREKPSRWQTTRTYGAFGVLLAIITALVFLGFWFMKGSEADGLKIADESYQSRDYPRAVKRYTAFISNFPASKDVSFARCRIVVAEIRQATENSGDVFEGTKVSQKLLPGLMEESELSDVRADLAGALINIANRLVAKAESAKTNEERQSYVDGLKDQLDLIQNSQYIASQERKQNEPKIVGLEESRQRLLRDIHRSEDLAKTSAEMKAAIETQDIEKAYQSRQILVRRYPQLQNDEELSELLGNATKIVAQRVETAKVRPQLLEVADEASEAVKRVLLTNSTGKPLQLQEDRVLFINAKRSLYGVQASSGKVLWRVFLGSQELSEPQSITDRAVSEGSIADCILTLPDQGTVKRIAAATGKTVWAAEFGHHVFEPRLDRQTMFIADQSGRLSCLDSESGQVRWSKQVPQPLATGPSAGATKQTIFVAGANSNIYAFSRRDGNCDSVFYLGHEDGTIDVPPIAILDRLLVFENARPGSCDIRVMTLSEDEKQLKISQDPIRLRGHVIVSPVVDGRRIVVVTDLGEVGVFEIETISGNAQLVEMSRLVASELQPKTAWPLLAGNNLFVSASQLTMYEIQAARQLIDRKWVREDEDRFLTRPLAVEDSVVHVRNVRGTDGVRITAIDTKNGNPIWETNVGVPVVALMQNDGAVDAITSQAELFRIDKASLTSGSVESPVANPGLNRRQMQFTHGAVNSNGKYAAVNAQRGSQIAVYEPKSELARRLIIVSTATGEGNPSGDPIWLNDGIAIPMNDGQLLAIEPTTGKNIGSPIQPTLAPGQQISWATPTLLADERTLIDANSQKQLIRVSTGKQFSRLNEVTTANKVIGRLAAVQETVCVPTLGDQSSYIETYDGGDLKRKSNLAIEGRITWGMHTVDEAMLCYSNIEGLVAVDTKGEKIWTTAMPPIAPVGHPLKIEDDILLATISGTIYRVEMRSGSIVSSLAVGESISATPLLAGTNLLVPGDEGSVSLVALSSFVPYVTDSPATTIIGAN